jgi:hypothetical protein
LAAREQAARRCLALCLLLASIVSDELHYQVFACGATLDLNASNQENAEEPGKNTVQTVLEN